MGVAVVTTQAVPLGSTAVAMGKLRPPVEKPVRPESDWPAELRTVTAPMPPLTVSGLFSSVTQTLSEGSMARP